MDVNFMDAAYAVSPTEEVVATEVAYERATERESLVGIYNAVVRWTLLVTAFVAPLFFLPWTTGILELNKQLFLLIAAGVGLVAWLLSLVSSGRLTWRTSYLDKGVLAVIVACILAAVLSISRSVSVFGLPNNVTMALATVLSLSVLYFLVVHTTEDGGLNLRRALGVSLALAFVYGLLQIFGLYVIRFPFALAHAFNTVGSPDALGALAAVSLPLLTSQVGKHWTRYAMLVGFVAALAILVVLNWWVLWVIAIAGMVGAIAFGNLISGEENRGFHFSISRFLLPMTVIVIGVFLMVVHFNLNTVKNNLPIEVSPSLHLSAHVTKKALEDRFITGYGPGLFSVAFDKFGANQLSNTTLSSAQFFVPNAEFLRVASEMGIVGIVAVIILFLTFVQTLIFALRHRRAVNASYVNPMLSTLIALGAVVFLYSFSLSLLFFGMMILALTSLSLWGGEQHTVKLEDHPVLSMGSSLGFIGGLILVLVGIYFGFSTYLGDVYYARAASESDVTKAANELVSAINWNGHSDVYYRGASQAALGLLSQELQKKADPTDTQRNTRIQNYMSSAINLAKTATDLGPQQATNWDNLGGVYQSLLGFVDGTDKLSENAYLKAAELRPGDAAYFNKIGNLYLAKAALDQQLAKNNQAAAQDIQVALGNAELNFKKAVDLSNNFGAAIYNLGVVYDQEGKLTDAIKQLEKVAPFNSDQPNLLFELGLLYYRNNQTDQAFNALQQVLVLSPDFANAHWYLALIYEQRKDNTNAIAQLQKILNVDANKDNQTVLDELHKLQSGQPSTPAGVNQKPL
jgi:tetratricopeptide (TPR) repeat protein